MSQPSPRRPAELNQQGDLGTLLEGVLEAAIALVDADFGNIQLIEGNGRLKIAAQRNFPAWWIDYWDQAANKHGVCGESLVAGERVVVDDVEHSIIADEPAALESMRRVGVLAVQSTPLRGQRGQILGVFSTHYRSPRVHDERTLKVLDLLASHAATLVERDQLARVNHDHEIKFRAAVECSSDGFWIVDDQLRLVDVNEVYARRSGYRIDELLGMQVTDLDAEHTPESARRRDEDIRRYGYALFETTHRTKSGELWPVEVTVSYHPGPDRKAFAFLRDITKRNRLKETLRLSEERFRLALEATDEAVWDWNLKTHEGYISPAYSRMLGYPEQGPDFGAANFESLLHPDDRESVIHELRQRLQADGHYSLEFRMRRQDGSYCWILSRAKVVSRDADGQPERAVGTHMDITERKSAQAALQAYAAKLEGALAAMTDAVFISDAEGRFIHFNQAFVSFHRFGSLADCRRTLGEYPEILEITLPNGTLALLDQWAVPRALRGETAINQEYTLRRRDTGETWIGQYTLAPIRDADGRIVGSVVTARDITEQKALERAQARAQEAIRVSEQRLAESQKIAHVGSWEYELASAQSIWSEEQYRIHGLASGSPVPDVEQYVQRFALPDEVDALRTAFQSCIHQGEDFDREYRIVLPDGRHRWVHTRGCPRYGPDQAHLGWVGTTQDITELRQAEELANERLDESFRLQHVQMANELSSTLAHEINQPLAAIAIYVVVCRQLLSQSPLDREKLLDKIEQINQLSLQAGEIIRQMRRFFTRGKIQPRPMDLNAAIRAALTLMQASARRQNISLSTDLAASLPPVMGVSIQLEQVVLNLLRNAFDAISGQGAQGGSVKIESHVSDNRAEVIIADSGPGISADQAEQIFSKLVSDKPNGLGVGLNISRSLIEAHQGRLWVEPHVPGAIFHFELPLA